MVDRLESHANRSPRPSWKGNNHKMPKMAPYKLAYDPHYIKKKESMPSQIRHLIPQSEHAASNKDWKHAYNLIMKVVDLMKATGDPRAVKHLKQACHYAEKLNDPDARYQYVLGNAWLTRRSAHSEYATALRDSQGDLVVAQQHCQLAIDAATKPVCTW